MKHSSDFTLLSISMCKLKWDCLHFKKLGTTDLVYQFLKIENYFSHYSFGLISILFSWQDWQLSTATTPWVTMKARWLSGTVAVVWSDVLIVCLWIFVISQLEFQIFKIQNNTLYGKFLHSLLFSFSMDSRGLSFLITTTAYFYAYVSSPQSSWEEELNTWKISLIPHPFILFCQQIYWAPTMCQTLYET